MKKRIKIPLLVGSNGIWTAWGSQNGLEPDWACMGDCLDINGIYPPTEKRFWVEVEIEIPTEEGETVEGQVVES